MASKSQQSAAARAKAQAEVKAKERRTAVIIIAVSLVVIAAFAGVVFYIVNASKVPTLAEMWAQPNPPVPAGSDPTGGIGVGTGGTVGKDIPTDANRVDIYVDYLCPVCKQFEAVNAKDIDELREAGTIAVYYHPLDILRDRSAGTNYSTRAANAAAVIADQAPEYFLSFSLALFANQPEENTPGLGDPLLAATAIGVGVPSEVAVTFADGEFTKWVAAGTQQASIDGLPGTPAVFVNGELLDQTEVPYFQEGALKAYLEALPKPDGTPPGPGGN